jgi:hypothetical protein
MDAETRQDFSAFVAARSAALFRMAMALTGHRQQAEDLLQTVLAKSVRHWGRSRHGQPEAYLRTAMYRQCSCTAYLGARSPAVIAGKGVEIAFCDPSRYLLPFTHYTSLAAHMLRPI